MKKSTIATGKLCGLLAGLAFITLVTPSARAYDIIGPDGTIYTNVSASSTFSSGYVSANLFTSDVTGLASGSSLVGGAEYAKSGSGTAFVAFQVDQSYAVGSIYYAQRAGASTGDNMQRMSIWTSTSNAFTAADPGTAPATVINLTPNIGSPVWLEYLLTNTISGQYYLLKLEQTTVTGNPGGAEMRLGAAPPPTAPVVVTPPANKNIYVGGTAHFNINVTGPLPITYQWLKGSTPLVNGGRISGVNTATLAISGITNTDADNYSCTTSNSYGATPSSGGSLTVVPAPATAEAAAVLAASATAYWQFNELTGATLATDFIGGYDGTYGGSSVTGNAGAVPPTYPGFAATNTDVQTMAFTTSSAVALPAVNLGGTNVTLMAWINPSDSLGAQNPYTGILFCRNGGTAAGMIFSGFTGDSTQLAYQWAGNRYQFSSGLVIPNNQWSLVALVVTPTGATLYCGTNNVMRSARDATAEAVQTFAGVTYAGLDTDTGESARTFNGAIDDVAFFNRALSELEIDNLYAAGAGTLIPQPVQITTQPASTNLFLGENLVLSAQASGTPPLTYQWYKDGSALANATNATYAVLGVNPSTASTNYYVKISNSAGPVTSTAAAVTVSTSVLRVLDPKGIIYTGVNSSSTFSAAFASSNLFTTDVTGLAVGAVMTTEGNNHEFARKGAGDAWVTFQVDQAYPIGGFFWSQRVGSGTGDNMQVIDLWASQTNIFTTNDPGTLPDVSMNLVPNSGNPVWTRYLLPSVLTGQYFLMHLQQTTITGNPGGSEMRLMVTGVPQPVAVSNTASGPVLNWPAYGVLQQATNASGPYVNATGVTNGLPISAAAAQLFYRVKYY
jgi:hypothetical protein